MALTAVVRMKAWWPTLLRVSASTSAEQLEASALSGFVVRKRLVAFLPAWLALSLHRGHVSARLLLLGAAPASGLSLATAAGCS